MFLSFFSFPLDNNGEDQCFVEITFDYINSSNIC